MKSRLTEDDFKSLREVVFNAFNIFDIGDEELISFFYMLPVDIHIDIYKYGVSDTPTREKIHSWITNNLL